MLTLTAEDVPARMDMLSVPLRSDDADANEKTVPPGPPEPADRAEGGCLCQFRRGCPWEEAERTDARLDTAPNGAS